MANLTRRSIAIVLIAMAAPLCLAQSTAPAVPSERVALVIGNGAYKDSPLVNPTNDAADIAKALEGFGFRVVLKRNASTREMRQAIREFGTALRRAKVGLFYFAGHGMQLRGNNYLIPVGADIASEADIEDLALDANYALRTMEESQAEVNIVILDACRNNPFARSMRSATRGLATMTAATGSVIAFSTAPGFQAADGVGRNGTYTKHLLESLKQGDSDILKVFQRTRAGVVRETGGKQTPWESTSLVGDFYFREKSAPARLALAASTASAAASWDRLMAPDFEYVKFVEDLERFVREDRSPVSTLRALADSGDPLGRLRWCVLATNDRFNVGLRTEDGIAHCRELADRESPVGMYAYGRAFINESRPKQPADALPWMTKAAEKKFTPALYVLARFRLLGEALPMDLQEGIRLLREASETGTYPLATYTLGMLYMQGSGVEKNVVEGARLVRAAAESGEAGAMHQMGWMFEVGEGVRKEDSESLAWYRKAAEKGNAPAMTRVGQMYYKGSGAPKDEVEAVRWYRLSADKGTPGGLTNLAWMYANGRGGLMKNEPEALRLYRMAADKGEVDAMYRLALMIQGGSGTPVDPAEAARWFNRAADLGDTRAMVALGVMYQKGLGVAQDPDASTKWFRTAADRGNPRGMANFGLSLARGAGVKKDEGEAVRYFRMAADKGDMFGAINLAHAYRDGRGGIAQDAVQAESLYRKIIAGGDAYYKDLAEKALKAMGK